MNVVRNAIWLFVLFALIFGFGILWYIVTPMMEKIYNASNYASASTTLDTGYLNFLSQKTLIIQCFYLLSSMIVFLTFVSSVFDSQSFQGYIYSGIGGLIITPIIIYVVTTFWNTYALLGVSFSDISLVFIQNFTSIMLLNLVAGLLSFIFMRRNQ